MDTKLPNILKAANVTKFTKVILEKSYNNLQVKSKWKTLKRFVYFLKVAELWANFNIQIDITLSIFWEKLENYTF